LKKGRRALAFVSLVVFFGALVFVTYKIFQIRIVTVAGCESRSSDDIIALSGLEYDASVFSVDKQKVMEALSKDPYIKPVSVDIRYPDNVLITIEERQETACIEKDGAYIIIDHEGWVLRFEAGNGEPGFPLVKGLPADTAVVGERIGTSDTFKIGVLTRMLDALKGAEIAPVIVDVSLAADIVVTLPDGMRVEMGDDLALDEKIKLMKASREEIASSGKSGGILDVSSAKKAYYREK